MEGKKIDHCVHYFKGTAGFQRIFRKIKERYISLGRLGGTIQLTNLSKEESEALSGYFQKDYYKKSAQIKVEAFVAALEGTKFRGVDFQKVLEGYFGEKLESKKSFFDRYEREKEEFYNQLLQSFVGTPAYQWLFSLLKDRDYGYKIIQQRYDQDKRQIKEDMTATCKGYNKLPFGKEKIRLALFASQITKDPHAFDHNRICGKLLIYAIAFYFRCSVPENAEEQSELLYRAGLIKDEVSNFTLCSGIQAYTEEGLHPAWEGFYETLEPMQVSLWNLSKVMGLLCKYNKIYVFENPTVFSEILYQTKENRFSLMCTNGQLRVASLILLDKAVESGAVIYYSGDFDPEGIMIADRLKIRYGDKLHLWRYDGRDYERIQSKVMVGDQRLKKLDKIKSPDLFAIAKLLYEKGNGAYQELLLSEYVKDMKKENSL